MKFKNLIYDLVIESVTKNEAKFTELLNKWKLVYPEMTAEDAVKIIKRHDNIKSNITMDQPGVVTFLARYDGIPEGTKKYELKDLRDLYRFEVNHLVEFLTEFGNFSIDLGGSDDSENQEEKLKRIFAQKAEQKTEEKIEASKKMWFDESTATINENGFRVYTIKDQNDAIRMGYYYQELFLDNARRDFLENRIRHNPPWCVTGRGSKVAEYVEYEENGQPTRQLLHTQYSNQYINYRKNQRRTFYFVIDENKPTSDRYYVSALQIDNYGQFILTSMMNDGDKSKSWDEIVSIYPTLKGKRDIISYREYDNSESGSNGGEVSILNIVNENEGNVNDFCRLTKERKSEYVNLGGTLSKPRSWSCMDIDIKRLYISTLDTANATTKFNNFDFLSFALKTPGIQNSLEKRLQDLGVRQGIMFIINHLFNYEYKVARTSIDNEEIKAYVSNRTKKFGIFSTKSLNWLEMNNIKYNDEYTLKSKIPQPYMDKDMTIYLVETYVKNGVEDDSSFYIVVPASSQNKMAKGHFISSQMWKKVLEELRPQETGQLNLDKEKYTDIKEIKKGR
jgi:hypothetical protein